VTVTTGYPDFQAITATQSANLFGTFAQNLAPGTHTFGPVPVASWASMAINIRATAGACQVNVHHWADAAATQLIGGDSWPVRLTTKLTVITPLRGPYVSVDLTVTSGVNLNAAAWCGFQSQYVPRITFPVSAQVAFANGRALAASGEDFWDVPSICTGRAWIKFVPFDATGKLHLRVIAVNELGTFQYYVADFGFPTTVFNQLLEIPDVCCSVDVANTDAAGAHTYDVALIIPSQ
jgi:hypothetical protein